MSDNTGGVVSIQKSHGSSLMPQHYPRPTGYRMLVKPLKRESVSAGGIVLADETQQNDEMLNTVGQVFAQGDECYQHEDRIKGAWCKPGDWVLYRKHAGTMVNVKEPDGKATRLVFVADDEILAVTESPDSVVAYVA